MEQNLRLALEDLLLQGALVAASTLLLVVIILFTLATTWAEHSTVQQEPLSWWTSADVGTTILVVRILQGLLTALATAAVATTFTRMHWRELHSKEGIRMIDLIALTPTTLLSGTVRVMLSSNSGRKARLGATLRLLLTAMPWLGGVLLFARTSLVTVLDTATVYNVTAGIGPFNASYVGPFLDMLTSNNITTVPYTYSSVVPNLITNNLFSTVSTPLKCLPSERDLDCASYILSGGLSLVAPWTPPGNPNHQLVRIPDVPSIQLEFEGQSGPKDFLPTECTIFGSSDTLIGAELCLSLTENGSLHAGLFLCNGTTPTTCLHSTLSPFSQPNLTTTLSLHYLTTTLLTSRSNLTILSLSSLSTPTPLPFTPFSLPAYRSALSFLLDYRRSGTPSPSSPLELFWSNQLSLNSTFINGVVLQIFRSLLAFPIWMFNTNNYGNTQLTERVLNKNLPGEFYTKAGVVKPLVKLKFDGKLVMAFVVLEGLVLVVLWAGLGWIFLPWGKGREGGGTAFPVVDFLVGAEVDGGEGQEGGEKQEGGEGREVVKGLLGGELGRMGSKEVLQRLREVTVRARKQVERRRKELEG